MNGNVNSIEKYFSELFIFSGLEKEKLELIEKTVSSEIAEFSAGEKIYTPVEFEEKVGFIISGECSVEKMKPDGTTIPLNKLKKGDSFGILAVFSKSERFPTLVKSIKRSKILFFSKETVLSLVKTYPEVALAVITFMSDRIEFLNKKIATFSADSVEEKMIFYILSEVKRTNSREISLNLSKTARMLNVGRASLYRSISTLENASLIKVDNKKIIVEDLESLERITQ